jgi:hypothetical protein
MVLVLCLSFLGGCNVRSVTCLELSGGKPEKVMARLPLEPNKTFSLEFVNSIYLAPVRETLVYEPSEGISIVMVESPSDGVFEYYGLDPNGTGKALMRRRVGDIKLRSHDYTNHRLTVAGHAIQLKGLVPDGEPILVRVRVGADCGMLPFWR